MENFTMPCWFLTIIVLSFTFHNFSEAMQYNKKFPTAAVVGTVYCDTCFQQNIPKTTHFISGALVAVECGGTSANQRFQEEVKTNEDGEFEVHLPFSVSKHIKKIKGCSVKLISSNEPYCSIASTATPSSSLHLKSFNKETHIFSAGFFTFKPLKQPTLCNQKPSTQNSNRLSSVKFSTTFPGIPNFTPETKDPLETSELSNGIVARQTFFWPIPGLPPNPFLPPPLFPPNPLQPPPSILPPNPLQPPPSILPPNPLQPQPSILPPNPLQPPPSPPSIFPPNPLQPPPSPPSLFPPNPFPPIPGLAPPSPPPLPPPPALPVPISPFPFPPPSPGFPGIPPPALLKKTSP